MRRYLFLYFVCDVGVLEPCSVDIRLLLDQGGDSLAWPLTVRVALVRRGRRGVRGRWLLVAVDVLVTVLGLGGAAVDIDGARATGGDGSRGGSSTSIIAGIGVFRRVCRW